MREPAPDFAKASSAGSVLTVSRGLAGGILPVEAVLDTELVLWRNEEGRWLLGGGGIELCESEPLGSLSSSSSSRTALIMLEALENGDSRTVSMR